MLIDGVSFLEGAVNENFVIPRVTEYDRLHPAVQPTVSEIVYQVDGDKPGLYIYTGMKWIMGASASQLSADQIPGFTGDVTSTPGTTVLRLADIPSLSAGTYTKVVIDTTGRVVATLPATKLADYGITDAVNSSMLPTSGNATANQIVLGNDSRLTATAPLAHTHVVADITNFTTSVNSLIDTKLGGFTLSDKEDVINKDIDPTLAANSDIKYPSQKAVKKYIDDSITVVNTNVTSIQNNFGTLADFMAALGA